jgi:hypothetical protein
MLSSYTTWASRTMFTIDDSAFLHPRRMLTSKPPIPEGKDPDIDIVSVVSGGVPPQKRKLSKSQSSEIYVFQTCFRTMADTYTMTRNHT